MTNLTRRQTVTAGAASAIAAAVASAPGQANAKGPNDRRLWELVPQIDAAATAGDTPRVHALDREMRDTPADSASGLLAKLRGYFLKEPLPSEDKDTAHALDGTEMLASICRDIQRLAGEA